MTPIAKILIILGFILLFIGLLILLAEKLGFSFGHLPGDFQFQTGNSTCLIGLGTSLLLSILLTLVINILLRLLNK
jgi:hypothetical protein